MYIYAYGVRSLLGDVHHLHYNPFSFSPNFQQPVHYLKFWSIFFFISINLSVDKTSTKRDRYFGNYWFTGKRKVYAPKFQPMTLVKLEGFSKFECSIYSDVDFWSAISISPTGNSRSFSYWGTDWHLSISLALLTWYSLFIVKEI